MTGLIFKAFGGVDFKMKKIQVNLLGYMTGMPKAAVCGVNTDIFYVVDADRNISIYADRLSPRFYDRESGNMVRLADFSDFNTTGRFYLRAGYRRSDIFEISGTPYKNIRGEVLHGIYLNRCGFDYAKDDMEGRTAGRYSRGCCHPEPVRAAGGLLTATGGWHSGGGYGKNLLCACTALGTMMYAMKLFPKSIEGRERVLMTDECRWGLEWLLKMQRSDGSVYDRIYTEDECGCVIPEDDEYEYRAGEMSCLAALRFTAAAALGAQLFSEDDKAFSVKLAKAAEQSWLWILQTEEFGYYMDPAGAASPDGDGVYPLEGEFMWAMCEMYALTGSDSFREMIGKKYIMSEFSGFGNHSCGGFAALAYLLCDRAKDRDAEALIRKRVTDKAGRLWVADRGSGYHTARSAGGGYMFASNFHVLSDCMTFITAYLISGDRNFLTGATDQLSYIFGVNPMGAAYMTGNGENRCGSPSHRLSAAFEAAHGGIVGGMVVSGPNFMRNDEYSKWHIDREAPPAKCYVDSAFSSSTNMPSVQFSAPLIFISAFYDKVGRSALSGVRGQG